MLAASLDDVSNEIYVSEADAFHGLTPGRSAGHPFARVPRARVWLGTAAVTPAPVTIANDCAIDKEELVENV